MLDITFINVGYGESILIQTDAPKTVILIDGGSALDSEYAGNGGCIRAADYLREKGIDHIDLLVFSHVHEDHTCGLVPILNEIPVEKYWTSILLNPALWGKYADPEIELSETNRKALDSINTYSILMQDLPKKDITWLDGIMPNYLTIGDLVIDILGPEPHAKAKAEAAMGRVFTSRTPETVRDAVSEATACVNNASLILRLNYQGKSVLLCGDTNCDGFAHVLDKRPDLLRADVFKLGHHGQADSVSAELINAVQPSTVVCCTSNDFRNHSGSPACFETIRTVMGDGVEYLFHDGNCGETLCKDTSPRKAVCLHIDADSIRSEIIK